MPSAAPPSDPRDTVIPPKSGVALVMRAGETLRVTDLEGRQAADFICFNEHDRAERFSPQRPASITSRPGFPRAIGCSPTAAK